MHYWNWTQAEPYPRWTLLVQFNLLYQFIERTVDKTDKKNQGEGGGSDLEKLVLNIGAYLLFCYWYRWCAQIWNVCLQLFGPLLVKHWATNNIIQYSNTL